MRAIKLSGSHTSNQRLGFLNSDERRRYGPEIEGALAEYQDPATALQELLGPLEKKGMPKAVATLNARRLERLGYTHEMIVAGAMITLLNQPDEPWSYLERGLLSRWSGKSGTSSGKTPGGSINRSRRRPPKLYTRAEALEELHKRGAGTRLDDVFERADVAGEQMWKLK